MVTAAGLAGFFGASAGAVGTASYAAWAVAAIVVNLAVSAIIGKILAPRFPGGASDTKGLQTIIKSNIAARRVIYGECIVGGPYVYMQTKGGDNENLRFIIVLAGHPIEDVLGVFIGDEYVDISGVDNTSNNLDVDYYIESPHKFGSGEAVGHVKIIKNLGWGYANNTYVTDETTFQPALDDQARAALVDDQITDTGNAKWKVPVSLTRDSGTGLYTDIGDKLTNCAYVYMDFKYNSDVFGGGFPSVRFHVKGKRLYNPEQDSSLIAEGADTAGTHDLLDGETWEWSDNWALCCLDYLLDTSYGLGAKITGTLTEIDWVEAIQAYLDSSELVDNGALSPDSGNEARYTVNGIFETNSDPLSTMESLLTSGAGILIYSQGEYKLRAGKYRAPNSELDIINEDMIVSAITLRTHTPRSEIFNKVSGIFVDRGYDPDIAISDTNMPVFEPNDFPPIDPLDSNGLNPYEEIDGEEIIREVDFPFCINQFEAQRLARIQLERVRQGLVVQFEADLQVLKYSVGDTVYLEILSNSKYANELFFNRLGLNDAVQNRPDSPYTAYYKQFKIMEMSYTEQFTISVTLIEEAEELYAWNNGDANTIDYVLEAEVIVDNPTDTVMTPLWVVASPDTTIEEVVTATNISTRLHWSAPDRGATVNAIDRAHIKSYRVEYGIVTDPSETEGNRVEHWISTASKVANKTSILQGVIVLTDLYIDSSTVYDFRIKSVATSNRTSAWQYYSTEIGSDWLPTSPNNIDRYYIKATNGTAISNGTGTLTVEAHVVNSGGDNILTTGTTQLYVGGTTLVSVGNGYQTGSDGYTGVLDATNISGNVVIELRQGSGGTILDTITLVDIADGAAGGAGADSVYLFIEPTNGLAFTQGVNGGLWNPTATSTNLDITAVRAGLIKAKWSRQIDRDADGILTDGGATAHTDSNQNTARFGTPTITGGGTQALTVLFEYVNSPYMASIAETVITSVSANDGATGGAGADSVYLFIEPTNGLAFTQAVNGGLWNPTATSTNLDITAVRNGLIKAKWSRQIDRDADGILTDGGATAHTDSNQNTARFGTPTITGGGTQALTVLFEYVNSPYMASIAETVITSVSGTDGISAVTAIAEPSVTTSWVRGQDGTTWAPTSTTTQWDVKFIREGIDLARTAKIITRDADGLLTVSVATHKDGTNLSTGNTEITKTGEGTQTLTIQYDYRDEPTSPIGPILSSTAQTFTTALSGSAGVTIGDIDDFVVDETDSSEPQEAQFRVSSAGILESRTTGAGSWTTESTWIGNGVAADYECKLHLHPAPLSFFVASATPGQNAGLNTWLACDTTRTWGWTNSTNLGSEQAWCTLKFRRASDNQILASVEIEASAVDI